MKSIFRLISISWAFTYQLIWWGFVRLHLFHPSMSPAQRLSHMLENLGTTFVKLGQNLSLRQDILPEDYVNALKSLQDHVKPFATEIVQQEIEHALEDSIENLFATFETKPLAAASIGQVHKARLHDDREVIVKVRRPDLRKLVTRDIHLLNLVLRALLFLLPRLRQYDLLDIVREGSNSLMKEIDFRQEMRNTLRFREAFKDFSTIHIPAIIPELCTESVMVQELSSGRLVNTPSVRQDGPRLAINFSDAYVHQFFVMGYFHADPHPGNLFIMDSGKICFHDFGMVGYLDRETRRKLAGFFLALINQDSEWMFDAYLDLGFLGDNVNKQQIQRGLNELLQEQATLTLKDWSIATVMLRAVSMGWGSQLRMPHHLLILMHALLTMEATIRNLDPEFNMIEYWRDKGRALMTTALKEQIETSKARLMYEISVSAQDIPKALVQLMRKTHTGKFEIPLYHHGLRDLKQHIDRSSNRISLALVALGLYISSSLLAQSQLGPMISGMPIFALGGYALALWVTFRLLQGISRSGRA